MLFLHTEAIKNWMVGRPGNEARSELGHGLRVHYFYLFGFKLGGGKRRSDQLLSRDVSSKDRSGSKIL